MRKVTPITEQFQHFVKDWKESFWGDRNGHFPRHLWRKLRTTKVMERCFVQVRRRTRPMVCFVHENSVDRILYAIFNCYNPQWKNRTLQAFTQAA